MENSNIKKCGKKGCNREATDKGISRGKNRKTTYYCEQHLKQFMVAKSKKVSERRKKAILLATCRCRMEDGSFCGKPSFKLSPDEKISCCEEHYNQKIVKIRLNSKKKYWNNRTKAKNWKKAWAKANKDKIKKHRQQYYSKNKESVIMKVHLQKAVKWYYNFLIMKNIDPTFKFETFCDQESRKVFVRDMVSVGLFVENEHTFISDQGLRQRKAIDLRIDLGSKIYYIETKSTLATFSEKETQEQVELYRKLHSTEIGMGLRNEKKVKFVSWSPSGDNSDLSLLDMYQLVKKEISTIHKTFSALYPKRVKSKMKELFPFLDYQSFLSICDMRIKQLKKATKYCPSNPSFNYEAIKLEVVDNLLSGKIHYPSIDLKLLREEYGL